MAQSIVHHNQQSNTVQFRTHTLQAPVEATDDCFSSIGMKQGQNSDEHSVRIFCFCLAGPRMSTHWLQQRAPRTSPESALAPGENPHQFYLSCGNTSLQGCLPLLCGSCEVDYLYYLRVARGR